MPMKLGHVCDWLLFWVLANKSSDRPEPAGVASIDPVIPLPPLPEVDAHIILCPQQTEVVVWLPLGPAGVAPPAVQYSTVQCTMGESFRWRVQ